MTKPIGYLGERQDINLRQGADMVPSLYISLQNDDGSTRDVTNGSLRATISQNGVHVADMAVTKLSATVAPQFKIDLPHATTATLPVMPTDAPSPILDWGADYTEGQEIEPVAYGRVSILRNSVP